MSRESWGFRERRSRGQINRGNGREGDKGERNRMWMNRFEVLDRTGEVDDTQEIVHRSTPVRVRRYRKGTELVEVTERTRSRE